MAFISFLNPHVLWLLLLVPGLYYLYRQAIRKKKAAALKFSSVGLVRSAARKSSWRKSIIFYLSMSAVVMLLLGLADPHIPLEQTREGVNVVLVIDVSGSMKAEDYKPSRIEAAKRSSEMLLESLKPKDNAGIVIFESGATTAAYLSPFKDKVIEKLKAIKAKDGKTAIGDGLSLAIDMAISIPNKKKVIVMLSDGVNNAGVISPKEAISFARANKIQVNTIGMGTEGRTVIGHDYFGRPVYAELDEKTLKEVAAKTGGVYYRSVDSDTLEEIYARISEDIEREKEKTSIKDWLIAAAVLILLAEMYIMYGRYRIISI